MAVTMQIDDVSLPELYIDITQLRQNSIRAVKEETIGGAPVIWTKAVKEIPLDIKSDQFWTGTQLNSLQSLGASDTYSTGHFITMGSVSMGGRFRHEDYPWLEAQPVMQYIPETAGSIYTNVVIKFAKTV
jgi:hypothetical protein